MTISLIAFKNAAELVDSINKLSRKDLVNVKWQDFEGRTIQISTDDLYYKDTYLSNFDLATKTLLKKNEEKVT